MERLAKDSDYVFIIKLFERRTYVIPRFFAIADERKSIMRKLMALVSMSYNFYLIGVFTKRVTINLRGISLLS